MQIHPHAVHIMHCIINMHCMLINLICSLMYKCILTTCDKCPWCLLCIHAATVLVNDALVWMLNADFPVQWIICPCIWMCFIYTCTMCNVHICMWMWTRGKDGDYPSLPSYSLLCYPLPSLLLQLQYWINWLTRARMLGGALKGIKEVEKTGEWTSSKAAAEQQGR